MTYKHGLHEVKYQYGLHDTVINRIIRTDNGIVLEFDDGVYLLDGTGRETVLSKKCYLELKINDFDRRNMFEHISITLDYKRKLKEIEYAEFETMLSKNAFSVYLDYYCPFANSLLIKGSIDKYGIEFVVTEIAELTYSFDD